jgi:hypothetical protein
MNLSSPSLCLIEACFFNQAKNLGIAHMMKHPFSMELKWQGIPCACFDFHFEFLINIVQFWGSVRINKCFAMRIPVFCGGQLRQVKDVVGVATSYQS